MIQKVQQTIVTGYHSARNWVYKIFCRRHSGKKMVFIAVDCVIGIAMVAVPAYAADDPLTVVNNLSNFVFSLIRAVGLIILGWGIVQIGLSLQSHDPSQRSNGFLTLAGGIIITFAKEILTLITGG